MWVRNCVIKCTILEDKYLDDVLCQVAYNLNIQIIL